MNIQTTSRCGEMVDAVDSKSSGATRVGSNPTIGILFAKREWKAWKTAFPAWKAWNSFYCTLKNYTKILQTWGRFGLDRAPDVSKRRVGALFSVTNEQKKINDNNIVSHLNFRNAVAQAA